jgi:hypothetical protein
MNCLSDIEINSVNYLANFTLTKIYFEILVNLLKNLESPGNLILMILKLEDQFNRIHNNFLSYTSNTSTFTESNKYSNDQYSILYEKLCKILNKFKNKIEGEGANIKFTQNYEV